MTTGGAAGTGGGAEGAGFAAVWADWAPVDCDGKGTSIEREALSCDWDALSCARGVTSLLATVKSSPAYSQAATPAPASSRMMTASAAIRPRRLRRWWLDANGQSTMSGSGGSAPPSDGSRE